MQGIGRSIVVKVVIIGRDVHVAETHVLEVFAESEVELLQRSLCGLMYAENTSKAPCTFIEAST